MNKFDRYLRKRARENPIELPQSVRERVDRTLAELPEPVVTVRHVRPGRRIAVVAACVAFVTLFLLPNVSAAYAEALERIPVLGDLVRVVTIRNYFYQDSNHEMNIQVPELNTDTDQPAAQQINSEVDELTNTLVNRFYQELELSGTNGYGSIYVDYACITNTERWFTLKLSVCETAASSNSYFKYYHIDKTTGELITLGDLFQSERFSEVLGEEIRRQMQQQMERDKEAVYYINRSDVDSNFTSVEGTHNFYWNRDGALVVPFDKYEVAPGYMGCPEFVIDRSVIKDILKPEFSNLS